MKKLQLLLILGSLFISSSLLAQSQSDMKLNEFLVTNTNDFQDDFGQQNGWFELFNTSYGTVDIGGCYLTNDPTNLKKYIIPKGDVLTKIKPRQHILFWADGQPYRGTFHVNFTLEESDEIILVSSDGRTIIDRVKIPAKYKTAEYINKSFGRTKDGIGTRDGSEGWSDLQRTSPSTNNFGVDNATKSILMAEKDPYGIVMAITAMSVVFFSLILLYVIFRTMGRSSIYKGKKKAEAVGVVHKQEDHIGEVFAAISVALHIHASENETHDFESLALTIRKVKRAYSPWSSKIYTLRETPQIKK